MTKQTKTSKLSDLELQTSLYWNLSCVWNGRQVGPQNLTTGKALNWLNDLIYHLNPKRPLAHRINNLKQDIVIGKEEPHGKVATR